MTLGAATLSFGPPLRIASILRCTGAKDPSGSSPAGKYAGGSRDDSEGRRSVISIGVAEGNDSRIEARRREERSAGVRWVGVVLGAVGWFWSRWQQC
jgi:hypothetical protein